MSSSPRIDPPNAFKSLIDKATGNAVRTAVVHPVERLALSGAMEARGAGLVGPGPAGPGGDNFTLLPGGP